jgi:hypothetical protein
MNRITQNLPHRPQPSPLAAINRISAKCSPRFICSYDDAESALAGLAWLVKQAKIISEDQSEPVRMEAAKVALSIAKKLESLSEPPKLDQLAKMSMHFIRLGERSPQLQSLFQRTLVQSMLREPDAPQTLLNLNRFLHLCVESGGKPKGLSLERIDPSKNSWDPAFFVDFLWRAACCGVAQSIPDLDFWIKQLKNSEDKGIALVAHQTALALGFTPSCAIPTEGYTIPTCEKQQQLAMLWLHAAKACGANVVATGELKAGFVTDATLTFRGQTFVTFFDAPERHHALANPELPPRLWVPTRASAIKSTGFKVVTLVDQPTQGLRENVLYMSLLA